MIKRLIKLLLKELKIVWSSVYVARQRNLAMQMPDSCWQILHVFHFLRKKNCFVRKHENETFLLL